MDIKKRRGLGLLKNFEYKFIRLKYFILIVSAMLAEIILLAIYIINNEKIIYFNLFTIGVLYGATSIVIVLFALGCIVLILTDRSRNKKRIMKFKDFRDSYQKLSNKYTGDIRNLVKKFDEERHNFDEKVNYAIDIAEKYNEYLKEFSKMKVPNFLKDAFDFEVEYLNKEKLFFTKFSLLSKPEELEEITNESNKAYENFNKEINAIEKNLKLII